MDFIYFNDNILPGEVGVYNIHVLSLDECRERLVKGGQVAVLNWYIISVYAPDWNDSSYYRLYGYVLDVALYNTVGFVPSNFFFLYLVHINKSKLHRL